MNIKELEELDKLIPQTYTDLVTTPKRGYKYCPCGKYIPARKNVCPFCQKEFAIGEKYEPPKQLTPEDEFDLCYARAVGTGRIVYTPAGPCPIPFSDDVVKWCEAIIELGQQSKLIYMPSALIYWMHSQTKDYKKYRILIKEWANDYSRTN